MSYHINQDVSVHHEAAMLTNLIDAAVNWKPPNVMFTPIVPIFTPLLFRFHTYDSDTDEEEAILNRISNY